MLPISRISDIITHTDDWKKKRWHKITASLVGNLIGKDSHLGVFSTGGKTYIRLLVSEYVNQRSTVTEFFSKDTDWGNAHEPEGLAMFEKTMGSGALLKTIDDAGRAESSTHRLIVCNDFIGCTPDGLYSKTDNENYIFSEDGTKIKVAPVEGKCPARDHRFLELFECESPIDLKKKESKHYYQVLFQMMACESTVGYYFVYHPDFAGKPQIKIIKFSRLVDEVNSDIMKMKKTIGYALKEIEDGIKMFIPEFVMDENNFKF